MSGGRRWNSLIMASSRESNASLDMASKYLMFHQKLRGRVANAPACVADRRRYMHLILQFIAVNCQTILRNQ